MNYLEYLKDGDEINPRIVTITGDTVTVNPPFGPIGEYRTIKQFVKDVRNPNDKQREALRIVKSRAIDSAKNIAPYGQMAANSIFGLPVTVYNASQN